MTKKERQNYIVSIITEREVSTQEELNQILIDSNVDVSQATLSRDINELNLTKIRGLNVKYKYALPSIKRNDISPKIIDLFKHTLVSIEVVNNLIVLKTLNGNGGSAGMAVDEMKIPEILGTIAGDDTLLIITKTEADAQSVAKSLRMI